MKLDKAIDVVRAHHGIELEKLFKNRRDLDKPVAKFAVGDLVVAHDSDTNYWTEEMASLAGSVLKIITVYPDSPFEYMVEGCESCFSQKDFVRATDEQIALSKLPPPPLSQCLRDKIEKAGGKTGTATFGIRYDKGHDYIAVADICHARMKWQYGEARTEMVEIRNWVAGYRLEGFNGQALIYDKYLHYMLNDSPWAVAFLTKDITEAYRDGVSMDLNQHISVIVGACIAVREGWEYKVRMRLFDELLTKGVSYNVAYLVSAYIGYKPDGKSYCITGITQAHNVLHQAMSWVAVKRFFREGYVKGLKGVGKDRSQTHFQIFNTIVHVAGDQFSEYRARVGNMEEIFDKAIGAAQVGEGFLKKTTVDQACVDRLVEFLTKELA